MAGKFMRIKKIVIPFITLVILTSQLTGCATLNKDEMLQGARDTPDVVIEYTDVDSQGSGQGSSQGSDSLFAYGKEYTTDQQDPEIGLIADQQEKQEISQEELLEYFQRVYDSCTGAMGPAGDIELEIDTIQDIAGKNNKQLPGDYAEQYKAWRPVAQESQATLNFTEVNEVVYATGTVNLRSGPGTSYEKVGSLSSGQQVTRTGIGISGTEAEGWSRITVDGKEVYVNSTYLSTTKPAAQQTQQVQNNSNKNTNTNTQQQQTPQQSTQQQTTKPSSGGKDIYDGFNTYEEYINNIKSKFPDITQEQIDTLFPDQSKMGIDEAAYNQDANAGLFNHAG